MPKRKSLTSATATKVRTAEKHAVRFSKAVRDAMSLADRFEHIQPDEYILPIPHMDSPADGPLPAPENQYPFEQIAYSRL